MKNCDDKKLVRQKLGHRESLQDNVDALLMLLDNSTLASVELAVQGFVCCSPCGQYVSVFNCKVLDGSASIQQESKMLKTCCVD